MSDRGKPSVGFWAAILVASVPVLYILSFGPACWLISWGRIPVRETAIFYRPLVRAAESRIGPVAVSLNCYGRLLPPKSEVFFCPNPVWRMDLELRINDALVDLQERRY